ncbi:MAG: hypothetical protein V8T10_06200 [Merdibacter sp.]
MFKDVVMKGENEMDVESYTHYQECMKQPIRPGLVLLESHNGLDLGGNLFAMARCISASDCIRCACRSCVWRTMRNGCGSAAASMG